MNGVCHCIDVREHLIRSVIVLGSAFRSRKVGAKEPLGRYAEALDVGRCYRFGAEQEPSERFGIRERPGSDVEAGHCGRRISDVGSHIAIERKRSSDEAVGYVGVIGPTGAVATRNSDARYVG
jgi:hypothetical protein